MADQTISELDELLDLAPNDQLVILDVSTGQTKRIPASGFQGEPGPAGPPGADGGGGGSGDLVAANNLSDLANAATARTNLGVAIGTHVQAYDADLATIAAANNGSILAATTASFTTADEAKLDGLSAGAPVILEYNGTSYPARSTVSSSIPVLYVNRINEVEPTDMIANLDLLLKRQL